MHIILATLQLIGGQTGVLTTKHQCDLRIRQLLKLIQHLVSGFTRIQHRPGNAAIAGTGAEHQRAIGDGVKSL